MAQYFQIDLHKRFNYHNKNAVTIILPQCSRFSIDEPFVHQKSTLWRSRPLFQAFQMAKGGGHRPPSQENPKVGHIV